MRPLLAALLLTSFTPAWGIGQTQPSPDQPIVLTEGPPNTRERYSLMRRIVRNLEQKGFFGPQTIPDSSGPVDALIPEWAPASATLLSIHSMPSVLGSPASYNQYATLIGALLPATDVMVFYPEKEETLLGELIERLESEADILAYSDRLSFHAIPGPSIWLRDNGPLFGRDASGNLIGLDFAARPFVEEEEIWYTTPSEIAGVEWEQETSAFVANRTRERIADATPVAMARHLNLKSGSMLALKRPPISLQGGDYIFDGKDNIFVSHETLQANGGDKASFVEAFRRHVFPANVHFLFPLPGSTPKHLDMVVKFIDQNTVLIADPPPPPKEPESAYLRRLRFEIEAVLSFNRKYLEKTFPDLRIVRIPLPPVLDEPPARILNRLRWRIIARVCELNQLNLMALLKDDGDPSTKSAIEESVFAAISQDLNAPNQLASIDELQAAALHYLRMDLNTILETNVPFITLYRSPINSLSVANGDGRETLILPRFAPRDGESPADLQKWHATVESAYRSVRPNATLKWVNADTAAELQGGLHCMAITLPEVREP
ncbi:MAG: Porphyromonas-type peptidyl-arginine deiminase [Verrucomicrobiota bacterium]